MTRPQSRQHTGCAGPVLLFTVHDISAKHIPDTVPVQKAFIRKVLVQDVTGTPRRTIFVPTVSPGNYQKVASTALRPRLRQTGTEHGFRRATTYVTSTGYRNWTTLSSATAYANLVHGIVPVECGLYDILLHCHNLLSHILRATCTINGFS
jgi:hypothetical protein